MNCRRQVVMLGVVALAGVQAVGGQSVSESVAQRYLDAVLRTMEAHSLRRDSVDWVSIRRNAFELASDAVSTVDTYPAIRGALRELGDGHSSLWNPPRWGLPSALRPASRPAGRRIGADIGYVEVPGFTGPDPEGFASAMDSIVRAIDARTLCGWIIDVRGNRGGNMWPMLSGLRSLLGGDAAGAFRYRDGRLSPWRYPYVPAAALRTPINAPVAVLTDGRTASAGEAVVVAFRGRPRSRSFGGATRGLSTANRSFRLLDGATLALTVGVFVDRDGVEYGGRLTPDAAVDPSEATEAAAAWLRSSCQSR